ncbi:hypothetical protein [Tautonia sociabilis]|nr:hypothetical protein [Tautonia sociabilis]
MVARSERLDHRKAHQEAPHPAAFRKPAKALIAGTCLSIPRPS